MAVDEGAERQAITPAQVEVLHVDVLVGGGLALAPEQQTLLGGHLLNRNVLDGEPGQQRCYTQNWIKQNCLPQDNSPDHSKGHLDVSVNDF